MQRNSRFEWACGATATLLLAIAGGCTQMNQPARTPTADTPDATSAPVSTPSSVSKPAAPETAQSATAAPKPPTSTNPASPKPTVQAVKPTTAAPAVPTKSTAPAPPKAATAPTVKASPPAPVAAATPAAPTLDLRSLEQRLRDTRAIGMMTKLSIKNQVDDLLDDFRAFYAGKVKTPISDLRQRYDLLLMKVLSLLQDSDVALASAISSSREAIWGILRDPKQFAEI